MNRGAGGIERRGSLTSAEHARGYRGTFTSYTAKRLGGKRVHLVGASEAGFVDDPESAVLLPWKVAEEVILWVYIVAKRLRAEEGVKIAAVGELAKDLADICSAQAATDCGMRYPKT